MRRDVLLSDGIVFRLLPPTSASKLVVTSSSGINDSFNTVPFSGRLGRISERRSVGFIQLTLEFMLLPLREVPENLHGDVKRQK